MNARDGDPLYVHEDEPKLWTTNAYPRAELTINVPARRAFVAAFELLRLAISGLVDGSSVTFRFVDEPLNAKRRSSSKVVLLALGVGAALGFVAGWVAR